MDSATVSALAALSGAVIGGVTSFGTSWLSQQTQAKVQARAHKLSQREELYKHFIEKASKAYADSLVRQTANLGEVTELVDLFAFVSMMRVISSYSWSDPSHKWMRSGLQVAATSSTHLRSFLLRIWPAASDTGDSCSSILAMKCLSPNADKDHFYHTNLMSFIRIRNSNSINCTSSG